MASSLTHYNAKSPQPNSLNLQISVRQDEKKKEATRIVIVILKSKKKFF
jgi:hypothetical protein